MALRVRDTPSLGVRVSYAILATVVGGLGGLLVLAIVYPLVSSSGVCDADTTLFCSLAVGILGWVVGTWLVMGWLTYVLRLTWRFMVLTVALQVLVIELVFQTDQLWWLAGLLVVPLVAALVSDPGRALEDPPRWRSVAILVFGVIVYVEFLVWGWYGVLAGG